MHAVPAHHVIVVKSSDLCSVLSSFRAAHRCSSSGDVHGDAYDGIGPSGAGLRPAHPICGRSAGRPLSKDKRKSRFCSLQHAATQRARDSGSSPTPCRVSRANSYPLRQCRRTWPSCLRERRKSDFSLFGGPQWREAKSGKMFGRGSERFGVCFETYSNVYQPVRSLGSNVTFFTVTLNQVAARPGGKQTCKLKSES